MIDSPVNTMIRIVEDVVSENGDLISEADYLSDELSSNDETEDAAVYLPAVSQSRSRHLLRISLPMPADRLHYTFKTNLTVIIQDNHTVANISIVWLSIAFFFCRPNV